MTNPKMRCASAQNDLEKAQKDETYERSQAGLGKRASAGLAITDAMERTQKANSNVKRECKN